MKIVAVAEKKLDAGGGFNQSLSAILQMQRLCAGRFEFGVLSAHLENRAVFETLKIPFEKVTITLRDRAMAQLAQNALWIAVQRRLHCVGPLERQLLATGCDLAYWVTPSSTPLALQRLNFIATVWDLCHRDFPEFPEVRAFGEFSGRERMFEAVLPMAYAVISDSAELSQKIVGRYSVEPQRIVPMPYSPAPTLSRFSPDSSREVLERHNLKPGYFFYPAQLWPHKNHARILEATSLLKREGIDALLVFTGGDQGVLGHLQALASGYGIEDQVRFLGFARPDEMNALYAGCRAVIMPTYFGPTNIPPLEAWGASRPLIYSRHLAAQVGDAALLVDPDDATSVADAMRQCFQEEVVRRLTDNGSRRLDALADNRVEAEAQFLKLLQSFSSRRSCWPVCS